MWQDIALAVLNVGLSISLLPAVLKKKGPDRLTCFLSIFCLVGMGIVLAMLELWWTWVTIQLALFMWLVLIVQTGGATNAPASSQEDTKDRTETI